MGNNKSTQNNKPISDKKICEMQRRVFDNYNLRGNESGIAFYPDRKRGVAMPYYKSENYGTISSDTEGISGIPHISSDTEGISRIPHTVEIVICGVGPGEIREQYVGNKNGFGVRCVKQVLSIQGNRNIKTISEEFMEDDIFENDVEPKHHKMCPTSTPKNMYGGAKKYSDTSDITTDISSNFNKNDDKKKDKKKKDKNGR